MVRCVISLMAFLALAVSPARAQSIDDLGAREVAFEVAKSGQALSASFTGEATGLVVIGRSSNRELEGQVRFGDGAWRNLVIVFSATGETFLAGYHGEEVFSNGSFDVRFDAAASVQSAGVFDNRQDADRIPEEGAAKSGRTRVMSHVDAPRMYDREAWNASPFIGSPVPLARPNYLYITFHHAAGFGAYTLQEGLEQVKAIQTFHQEGRGWSDIGYQFVMDQSGRMYQGRPFLQGETLGSVPQLAMGAHVGGANTGNIGICALGCYHPPEGAFCEDVLSEPARDSVAVMFAFFSESYGVPLEDIRGHRDFASTACPGDNNYVLLDDLRARAEVILEQGVQPKPETYTLDENFPNPFTGSTTIRYFLEQEGIVRLSIFDALGREIAVLVDEHQDGDQWHRIDFEAAGLAAGTYFYRIEVEGFSGNVFVDTGTMVLVGASSG